MRILKLEKTGCNPCEMVQNFLDSKNVKVERVNVFDEPEVAARFEIASVPTIILLDNKGEEVQRSIGFKPNELKKMISKLK